MPPAFRAWTLLLTPALLLMTACGVWPAVAAEPAAAQTPITAKARAAAKATAVPAKKWRIEYLHNRDGDFTQQTALRIESDGRAELSIPSNTDTQISYGKNVPCVGIFQGQAAESDRTALEALFQSSAFREAQDAPPEVLDGTYSILVFEAGASRLEKKFYSTVTSPEAIALLRNIYARLSNVRNDLLKKQPSIGLNLQVGTTLFDYEKGLVDIELVPRNMGIEPLIIMAEPSIYALARNKAGSKVGDFQPLAGASTIEALVINEYDTDTGKPFYIIAPGASGKPLGLRANVRAHWLDVALLLWTGTFQVQVEPGAEPMRFTFKGTLPYSLPDGIPILPMAQPDPNAPQPRVVPQVNP